MLFFTAPLVAQATPQPSATAQPAATPASQGMTISWPSSIVISAASAANFGHFNHGGGSIIVILKCDGTKSPIIPPTADIDGDLKAALVKFVSDAQVTADSACHNEVFLVGFAVPSGEMKEVELPPPSR